MGEREGGREREREKRRRERGKRVVRSRRFPHIWCSTIFPLVDSHISILHKETQHGQETISNWGSGRHSAKEVVMREGERKKVGSNWEE